ncbi:MAG TPA: LemA family protein [Chitinophagales bacterium]|nr:LemA family protein [Chitinophagales bacterium]
MRSGLTIILVLVGLGLLLWFIFGGAYNSMVTLQENTAQKWALVESQYQRRNDLFNNVVNTIRGSAEFERGTLEAVVQARASATQVRVDPKELSPEQIQQFQQAQQQYSSAFSRLLVTVEQYPQLQTTVAFRDFQAQIEGTENRINKSRDDFNVAVQEYNTTIKRFPRNLIAGMFGFRDKGYFQAQPGTENAPTVDFSTTPQAN